MNKTAFAILCGFLMVLGLAVVVKPQPAIQAASIRQARPLRSAVLPVKLNRAQDAADAAPAAETSIDVTVNPETPGRAIAPEFLGFSFEAPVLAKNYFNVHNKELRRLLANLGTGVLRFGGNSVEFTYWSRNGKLTAPHPKARAILTPKDLKRVFKFSKKTGWPVMLGLNLGHYNPQMAADEAAFAVKHGKKQLLALEIGNEPDLYPYWKLRPKTWDYAEFHKQFVAYLDAIRARAPHAPISGPTTCCKAGFKWFPRFLDDEASQLVMATHHNYPTHASRHLPRSSPRYPSVQRLLEPELMEKVAKEVHQLVQESEAHHLRFRMAEANSNSYDGGVDGQGNVFGAALWGADYCFTLARQGAVGVNFHGGFPHVYFSPLGISQGHYVPQPLYYGMLLFHAATPGRFVPVELHTQANVAAFGVLAGDGELHLVLINKDGKKPFEVRIAGLGSYQHASVLRLTAPGLSARSGITFAGHSVSLNGNWSPGPAQQVARQGEDFGLQLPAASAALVNFEK